LDVEGAKRREENDEQAFLILFISQSIFTSLPIKSFLCFMKKVIIVND